MPATFGIIARPGSMNWNDVCKGRPAEAVLQHLHRMVYYWDMQAGPRGRT